MVSLQGIKQRKLFQWAAAYLAAAWLILQVLDLLADNFHWPERIEQIATVLLATGFLAALVIAWYHGEKGQQRVSGAEVVLMAGIVVLAGLGVAWVDGRSQAAAAPTAAVRIPAAPPSAAEGSIAVLPFVNMSSDPEQEYFSDGLTEELLNVLAKIPELKVAARTSSFAFKDKNVPVDSVARVLRVEHVLEGSVRKAGNRVRITAQLINPQSGYHLWSETYDRELKDIFAIQDEISRAIAEQLRLSIRGDMPLAKQETADPEAHALVLRGMAASRQGTPESYVEAVRLYRSAIARDPQYARAHALLAGRLMWQAYFRYMPRKGYEEARAEAERALALDPELGDAHIVRGIIANLHEWDFARADHHFRRALAIKPGDAAARGAHAWLLMRLSKREEAIQEARRAVELDPLSFATHNTLGLMYLYARRPEQAVEAFRAALALAPESPHVVANLARGYSQVGRHADAIRMAEQARTLAPNSHSALVSLGHVYARAGRRSEAERVLGALEAQPEVSNYLMATVYAALADRERAFTLLERAVQEHDDHASWLAVTPEFDALREDPRFVRLLQRSGLR